jgi:hypothetical protein
MVPVGTGRKDYFTTLILKYAGKIAICKKTGCENHLNLETRLGFHLLLIESSYNLI